MCIRDRTKEGVKTTASGLQYKVITEGKGEIPNDTCKVKVNYRGKLIDGDVYKRQTIGYVYFVFQFRALFINDFSHTFGRKYR